MAHKWCAFRTRTDSRADGCASCSVHVVLYLEMSAFEAFLPCRKAPTGTLCQRRIRPGLAVHRDSRLSHRFLAELDAVRAEGVGVIFRAKSSGKRGPQLEKAIERPWQRRNIIAEQDRSTSSMCDDGVHLMSIRKPWPRKRPTPRERNPYKTGLSCTFVKAWRRPINLVWDDYGTISEGVGASRRPRGADQGGNAPGLRPGRPSSRALSVNRAPGDNLAVAPLDRALLRHRSGRHEQRDQRQQEWRQ